MTAQLVEAYRNTRYALLDARGAIVAEARIDHGAPDVDAFLEAHGAASGVFITAWNPRSEATDGPVNDEAHARLVAHLGALGLTVVPHIGFGQDAAWRPEQGLFVLDLAEADAVAIAEAYEQNAIVIIERGRPARLVLTDVMSS